MCVLVCSSVCSSHTLKDITVFTGSPSDHHIVKCDVNISTPLPVKTTIRSRKLCDIRVENFVRDIHASTLFNSPVVDLSHSIEQYENVLCDLIDKHAPVKERSVVLRPSSPWYCDELRKAKRMKRRSERKWLKSGLEIDKQIYCDQSKAYHRMIEQVKCNYHRNEIAKCDEKQLLKLVDRISNPASTPKLPDHDSKKSLANDFSRFFHNKIQMLLNRLTIISLPTVSIDLPESCGSSFTSFHEVSKEEVQKIIMNSATKSCALDPIPTILFKQCLDSLLPVVTSIVNTSLSSGCLPRILKVAHVTPILKKPKLDRNDLKNYRPISNLKVISKVIERVVSAQLTSYFQFNQHIVSFIVLRRPW